MKREVVVLLIVLAMITPSCAVGNAIGIYGPTDAEISNLLTTVCTNCVTNLKITDKQPCELSNNTKATGVSERWVITINATVKDYWMGVQNWQGAKITIQKQDGKWVIFTTGAMCRGLFED